MNMKISCALLMCFFVVANGCQTSSQNRQKSEWDSFVFMVDRRWEHGGASEYELLDSDYKKDTRGITYPVEFSADGNTVKIGTDCTIDGYLKSDADGERIYIVNIGPGGGHLAVRPEGTGYEAELTYYGSGILYISSVRGKLVRKESTHK